MIGSKRSSRLAMSPNGQADKVLIAEQGLTLHLLVPRAERVCQSLHLGGGKIPLFVSIFLSVFVSLFVFVSVFVLFFFYLTLFLYSDELTLCPLWTVEDESGIQIFANKFWI